MAANSRLRRALKRILAPLVSQRFYKYFQSLAMAWDIRRGSFREPELDLIPAAVRPGETVLDLGANFGLYAYPLSRAVGGSGRVYAFEPISFTADTLELIVRILRLGNVTVIRKGCSDRAGTITFTVPVQTSGAFSAGQAHIARRDDSREGKERHVRWAKSREITCEVVALDEALPELDDLSFIKADIEGAELLAFRGAERLIRRHLPTVICEINPWFLEGFGIRLEDLTGFFFEKEYLLYRYEERRLYPITDVKDITEDNYVFVHPRRLERFGPFLQVAPAGQSV